MPLSSTYLLYKSNCSCSPFNSLLHCSGYRFELHISLSLSLSHCEDEDATVEQLIFYLVKDYFHLALTFQLRNCFVILMLQICWTKFFLFSFLPLPIQLMSQLKGQFFSLFKNAFKLTRKNFFCPFPWPKSEGSLNLKEEEKEKEILSVSLIEQKNVLNFKAYFFIFISTFFSSFWFWPKADLFFLLDSFLFLVLFNLNLPEICRSWHLRLNPILNFTHRWICFLLPSVSLSFILFL